MAIVRYPKQFHHLSLQTMWSFQRSSKLLSSHPEQGGWGGGNGSSSDRSGLEVPNDDIKRTKRVVLAIAAPRPPPLLRSAERAVVSSCWEEVILALEVRYRDRATSGQHWEVGQDACRPGVTWRWKNPIITSNGVAGLATTSYRLDTRTACFLLSHPIVVPALEIQDVGQQLPAIALVLCLPSFEKMTWGPLKI